MELRHLRYFVSVAEALSFTKAAAKLHTAQPSLTRQIKDLEEELGVRLLNRTKQQVTLTDEGRSFLVDAKRVLSLAAETVESVRRLHSGEVGALNVGYSAISFTIFCRRLWLRSINRFRRFRLISRPVVWRAISCARGWQTGSRFCWIARADCTARIGISNRCILQNRRRFAERQSSGGQSDSRAESSWVHVFHRNVRSELSRLSRLVS